VVGLLGAVVVGAMVSLFGEVVVGAIDGGRVGAVVVGAAVEGGAEGPRVKGGVGDAVVAHTLLGTENWISYTQPVPFSFTSVIVAGSSLSPQMNVVIA